MDVSQNKLFNFSSMGNFEIEDNSNLPLKDKVTINSSDVQYSVSQKSIENFIKEDTLLEKDSIPLIFELFE